MLMPMDYEPWQVFVGLIGSFLLFGIALVLFILAGGVLLWAAETVWYAAFPSLRPVPVPRLSSILGADGQPLVVYEEV